MYSGTLIQDLCASADRVSPPQFPTHAVRVVKEEQFLTANERWEKHEKWAEVYFATGELILPVWEILMRIRQRLCDGADDDGVMSPGAVAAYLDLQPIQDEFVMGE